MLSSTFSNAVLQLRLVQKPDCIFGKICSDYRKVWSCTCTAVAVSLKFLTNFDVRGNTLIGLRSEKLLGQSFFGIIDIQEVFRLVGNAF